MPELKITRKVEVISVGQWLEIPFKELRVGDLFRMFEANGDPADDGEICVALRDAKLSPARDGENTIAGVWCEPAGRKDDGGLRAALRRGDKHGA